MSQHVCVCASGGRGGVVFVWGLLCGHCFCFSFIHFIVLTLFLMQGDTRLFLTQGDVRPFLIQGDTRLYF